MSVRPTTFVISNIPWDFVWQRHQTLATLLSRDSDVVFCEILGIRRIRWNDGYRIAARMLRMWKESRDDTMPVSVRIVRPVLLPATNGVFHSLNEWLLKRWLRGQPELAVGVHMIWNYSASRSARWLIEHVPHHVLVYDCTDDWLAVSGVPECLSEDERALLSSADLTLVPSRTLAQRKARFAKRIERVPHGALVDRFLTAPKTPPLDDRLTLLYYGHLHAQHLDFATIETIARARPNWRIVLVGPVKTAHSFPSNVELAGQQPHAALINFVRGSDVLLLPYILNAYTEAVMPAKIYECLATGRPVVAAPLPELVTDFSAHVTFARLPSEWVSVIERTLREETPEKVAARVRLARENSWDRRYSQIKELLAERPEEWLASNDAQIPVLSVVIVAYKSRDEISACLASLPSEHGGRRVDVIVVDNSPGDGTGDIVLANFPAVKYLAPEANLGFGRANNLGYAAIQPASEFVLFLNPDTVCNEAALMTCLARLRADRSIGLISPRLVLANGSMDLACRRSIPTLWDGFSRAVGLAAAFPRSAWFSGYNLTHLPEDGTYDVGAINGAFMMGRREVFDTVALKAEGLRRQADRIVADSGSKPPADGLPPVASFNDPSDGLLGRTVPPPASSLPRNASCPSPKTYSLPPTATRSAPVFDETFFMYGDDLDLCIRVAKEGWRIVYDGSVSITHLKGVSVAKDYDLMSRAIFDANREVYLKHFNPHSSRFVRWKYAFAFGAWKRIALMRARWRGYRGVRPA